VCSNSSKIVRLQAKQVLRSSFTLIELLAVLVIVGLITAIASLRLSGTVQAARMEWATDRLIATDSVMRSHAAGCGRVAHLRFQLGTGRLSREFGDTRTKSSIVDLGHSIEISRFQSTTRDAETGEATVDYSPLGASRTFAVELKGPGNQRRLLFFAGITGQVTRMEDGQDARRLLQALRGSGTDPG
jgi:prepilin-type N-terminal cleavage/methylation domain-containing protein